MNNELKIKPLLKYNVRYSYGADQDEFTADTMLRDDNAILFYRTGNLIRLYMADANVSTIVVTPVEDDNA